MPSTSDLDDFDLDETLGEKKDSPKHSAPKEKSELERDAEVLHQVLEGTGLN